MKLKKLRESEEKELDTNNRENFDEGAIIKESPSKILAERIKSASQGLSYISETDAEILPFVGTTAEKVDRDEIIKQVKTATDEIIKEKSFSDFFARLTKVQDWFEDEQKETTRKFVELREVLENNIRDLKVFKIGEVETNIYVVGLDSENTLLGIQTKAVETG